MRRNQYLSISANVAIEMRGKKLYFGMATQRT